MKNHTEKEVETIFYQIARKDLKKMKLVFKEPTIKWMIETVYHDLKKEDTEVEIRRKLRYLIKDTIFKSIQKNPQKFYPLFFFPFEESYIRVNRLLKIEDNEENKQIFIDVVLYVYLFCYNINRTEIENYYQQTLRAKKKVSKNIIIDPKALRSEEEVPLFLENHFKGDSIIFENCFYSLSYSERERLKSFTSFKRKNALSDLIIKLNERVKIYFLSSYNETDNLTIQNKIRLQLSENTFSECRQNLIQKLLAKHNLTEQNLRIALNSLKEQNEEKYHLVKMFLGEEIYSVQVPYPNISEISLNWLSTISKDDQSKEKDVVEEKEDKMEDILKNMFGYIEKRKKLSLLDKLNTHQEIDEIFTIEEVKFILTKWKKSEKEYYDILIKRHGEDLKYWNEFNHEDALLYNKAYGKLVTELRNRRKEEKNRKELKEMLKASCKTQKRNLLLIKKRRQGMGLNEIMYDSQISLETLCTIFAENILLFGNLIPYVVKDICYALPNGINLLLNSDQFIYIINGLSNDELQFWKKKFDKPIFRSQLKIFQRYLKTK